MVSAFIGRERELGYLAKTFASSRSGFVPVYGRRRVGKSELIRRYCTSHPSLYFLGKQAPESQQIEEFMRSAARAFDEPLLAAIRPSNWEEALRHTEKVARRSGKWILALDEFQWTVEASPGLPSALQGLWDQEWQHENRIVLILCGSYLGFMEKEVLGEKSPLFGRRTGQIFLKPFSFAEAKGFHPGWSLEDTARAFFICGGIPLYHRFFDPDRSIDQNIRTQFLDEFAPLYGEPDFLLREELRDLSRYHGILTALATQGRSPQELARETAIAERNLGYYLQNLIQLGYISKRLPLSPGSTSSRIVRYTLDDPLLRFWFRFIFPNTTFLAARGAAPTFSEHVKPGLESYFGNCFERLCRQSLASIYIREGMDAGFEAGEYWNEKVQIDLVSIRGDRRIDLGECKWGAVRSLAAVSRDLDAKLPHFPNPGNQTLHRRIFLRTPPKQDVSALPASVHSLEDLLLQPTEGSKSTFE